MTRRYSYAAKVHTVHDGDTFFLEVDLGFHCFKQLWVRLANVDCPELNTAAGLEARDYAKRWLEGRALSIVTLVEKDGDERQTFGRYVAHVYNEYGESLVSALVLNGHAKPREKQP